MKEKTGHAFGMKTLGSVFLVVLLQLTLLCGCRGMGSHPAKSEPLAGNETATVLPACESVAGLIRQVPGLKPQVTDGIVGDVQQRCKHDTGCTVRLATPFTSVEKSAMQDLKIRVRLAADGWKEDISYAADGPNTTAFAFRKGGILCCFSGGSLIWQEDGNVDWPTDYILTGHCFSE